MIIVTSIIYMKSVLSEHYRGREWEGYEVSRYKDRIAWSLRWFHNKQLQRLHVNMLYQGNEPWFSEMVNFPMFGVISD